MKDMAKEEVEKVLVDIFGIKRVEHITSIDEENILKVTIIVEHRSSENDETVEIKENIELTPEHIRNFESSKNAVHYHEYKQYMLTHGYNEYWRNNPFI